MAKAIKHDSNGNIIFNADVFNAMSNMGMMDQIKTKERLLDPNLNRKTKLENIIDAPAVKLNSQNRYIKKAREEFERTIEYNQILLEKGYRPENEKDRKMFKRINPETLAKVANVVSGSDNKSSK